MSLGRLVFQGVKAEEEDGQLSRWAGVSSRDETQLAGRETTAEARSTLSLSSSENSSDARRADGQARDPVSGVIIVV